MPRARGRTGAGSLSASTAASTRSRLRSGSPIPMNTMFVRRRPSAASRRAAWRTWSTISAVSRSRVKPSSPVAQNGQPTAQPAWLEMHSVCRSRLPVAGRVVHQHRLDERAVGEPVERLLGQPAVGDAELGVGDRVEAEVAPPSALAQSRRQGRDRRGVGRSAAVPDRVGDLPGAIGRLAAGRDPRRELVAASGRRCPGRSSVVTMAMLAQRGSSRPARPCCRRSAGRPRDERGPRHRACRRPAGPRGARAARPSPVARPTATEPTRTCRRVAGVRRRPDGGVPHDEAAVDGLDERSRPRLVRADLALELGRGRRGIEPPVLAAERPGQRRAVARAAGAAASSPREPRAERSLRAGRRRDHGEASPRASGAVSVPSSAHARPARRSARCRGPRPSASA